MTGRPIRTGGKKHAKERFGMHFAGFKCIHTIDNFSVVELNLRLPSMLHGKKGFQRIEWAFRNVLGEPITWLFFDLGTQSSGVAEGNVLFKSIEMRALLKKGR